jgi:glycosyltransferase involved in cell wall biosynthesis
MQWIPRVALFADTFYEVNGAARTCREWDAYARRKRLPWFVARCGKPPGGGFAQPADGVEISRGRLAFAVDADLRFDPLFHRHLAAVERALLAFAPDVVHLTSPGDLGILGAVAAARLRVPLALSWHTNLHEFAARRAAKAMRWFSARAAEGTAAAIERFVLDRVVWFFGRGDLIFAPNAGLIEMLRRRTGKPVFAMARGVDTELFHPGRRDRRDPDIVVGYTGRLEPEKNVRFLARLADYLHRERVGQVRFSIVGGGSEREWLEKAIPNATFAGVLTGEALARAYSNMDVFVFPSRTDTFGNVVQEALASGVPAVVTDAGGPRFIVDHGTTGWVAANDDELCRYALHLVVDGAARARMSEAACRQMKTRSWEGVFDAVYEGYRQVLGPYGAVSPKSAKASRSAERTEPLLREARRPFINPTKFRMTAGSRPEVHSSDTERIEPSSQR